MNTDIEPLRGSSGSASRLLPTAYCLLPTAYCLLSIPYSLLPTLNHTGDLGETALNGGPRVGKDHYRIEALGAVDELTSALGVARAFAPQQGGAVMEILDRLIKETFILSGELAAPQPKRAGVPRVCQEMIDALEKDVARFPKPEPKFVEPPRDQFGALLFSARATARRAERCVVSVVRNAPAGELVNPLLMTYLNRAGELLFILALNSQG